VDGGPDESSAGRLLTFRGRSVGGSGTWVENFSSLGRQAVRACEMHANCEVPGGEVK
jgi:hypothetical protein